MQDVIRMTYDVVLCHEITNLMAKSSGWLSWRWYLIRMTYGKFIMSSGWHTLHLMSSGWLKWGWYLRMSYSSVIMSSGWDTLPILSHPDEITNFDFPHHAVALQRFRTNTNTIILTSVPAMLPRKQLMRKRQIVCNTVNQACKIQNLAEQTSQKCLLTVTLLYHYQTP